MLIVCTENAHAELSLIPKVTKIPGKPVKIRGRESKEEILSFFFSFFYQKNFRSWWKKLMLKNTPQFHSVNLGITVNSIYPISSSSGKKSTDGENIIITQGIACFATSVVLTAPPKTLLGPNFSAKFLLGVLKQVLFGHRSAAWPWGFPETDRECSCCVTKCTIPPSRYKSYLGGKAHGFLSEQPLDAGAAFSALLFPLCPRTASHTPPANVTFARLGVPTQGSKAIEESHSPNI